MVPKLQNMAVEMMPKVVLSATDGQILEFLGMAGQDHDLRVCQMAVDATAPVLRAFEPRRAAKLIDRIPDKLKNQFIMVLCDGGGYIEAKYFHQTVEVEY